MIRTPARTTLALAALVAALAAPLAAEIAVAPQPQRVVSLEKSLAATPRLTLEPLDAELLRFEDSLEAAKPSGRPLRVGVVEAVSVTPATHGEWLGLADGRHLWRLVVDAPGSRGVGLAFSRFSLPEGATLSIYAPDGHHWLRTLDARDNRAAGGYQTPLVDGSQAVLELVVAAEERSRLALELRGVLRGYRPEAVGDFSEKSGACNVDVVCPEGDGWRDQIRAVARIFFQSGASFFTCTGFLVNNTAQDQKAYFMTANHCIGNQSEASTVEVYWKFENSTCRAPGSGASGGPGNGPESFFQSGSTLRATFEGSDFTLLELSSPPQSSFEPFWAGWNRGASTPSSAVTIHHPQGDEKRISFEDDPIHTDSYLSQFGTADSHLRVDDWDLGTTEGGSSGSPLFDPNQRVIGQLHGGFAACGNDDSDWYGRFFKSWTGGGTTATRLQNWLDPAGTGATTLDGTDGDSGGPPAAPSNLTAVATGTTTVQLSWTDNSDNEDDFRVQVKTGSNPFENIPGVLPPNTTAAIVSGLTPATAYTFRVRARNEAGDADSNQAMATTFASGTCTPDEHTLCLNNGRFAVTAQWATEDGKSGPGMSGDLTDDTGYFWFFDDRNVEMVVKVLNACTPITGNRYWVFAGGLTNVEVRLTVVDVSTNTTRTYDNPLGTPFQPIQDTDAFATCP